LYSPPEYSDCSEPSVPLLEIVDGVVPEEEGKSNKAFGVADKEVLFDTDNVVELTVEEGTENFTSSDTDHSKASLGCLLIFIPSFRHGSSEHRDQQTSVHSHADSSEEDDRCESHESGGLQETPHFDERVDFSLLLHILVIILNDSSFGVFSLSIVLSGDGDFIGLVLGVSHNGLGGLGRDQLSFFIFIGVSLRSRQTNHPDRGDEGQNSEASKEGALFIFSDDGSTKDVADNLAGHHEHPEDTVEKAFVGFIGAQSYVTSVGNPEKTCTDSSDKSTDDNNSANSVVGSIALEIRRLNFSWV